MVFIPATASIPAQSPAPVVSAAYALLDMAKVNGSHTAKYLPGHAAENPALNHVGKCSEC